MENRSLASAAINGFSRVVFPVPEGAVMTKISPGT
jgi:hypothetical protein